MTVQSATRTAPPGAPGFLDPTRTVTFPSSRGAKLYGEWFASAGAPRALAVVVHGYAEHCGRYREVAHVLHRAGLAVLTFDLRGHGRSTGQRGHVEEFGDYLDDLDAAIGQVIALGGKDRPVLLVAHSNGGLIALRALSDARRRPDVAGVVVSSPFLALRMAVPKYQEAAAPFLSWLAPRLSIPNGIKIEDVTSDEGKLAERRADTLCHGVATARWFTEARAAQQYVYDNAANVAVPTLWLVSGADALANPDRTREIADRVRGPATYHALPGLKHECFNETSRDRVFGTLTTWLEGRLA